jgi:hypothetical protein
LGTVGFSAGVFVENIAAFLRAASSMVFIAEFIS